MEKKKLSSEQRSTVTLYKGWTSIRKTVQKSKICAAMKRDRKLDKDQNAVRDEEFAKDDPPGHVHQLPLNLLEPASPQFRQILYEQSSACRTEISEQL